MAMHFVNHSEYCYRCRYENESVAFDPCYNCLSECYRENSRKPKYYEERMQLNNEQNRDTNRRKKKKL